MEPLEVLGPAECWELLREGCVGRVAYTDRALPAIVPVNYAVVGGRLMLRLRAEGMARRLDGQIVAFEVDDADLQSRGGWSVVVTGSARLLDGVGELARAGTAVPPSWAGPDHQSLLAITPGDVQGRRLTQPVSLV